MKRILHVFVLAGLCFWAGCAWLEFKKDVPKTKASFVQSGKVINNAPLRLGGRLLLVPFRAGENVLINDKLDKIALLIIRGMMDTFENSEHKFELVFSENEQDADFIIEGKITAVDNPSFFERWFLADNTIALELEGKLRERATNYTLMVFKDRRESAEKQINHRLLGQMTGRDIGKFILSNLP